MMKKTILLVLLAMAFLHVAAQKVNLMGSWDYPEGEPLNNPENISVVLFPSSWKNNIEEKKDPAQEVQIYYKANFVKAGEKCSVIEHFGEKYEIPNSLIIPIYKHQKAKKGDVVLTWWQSGSGMQRAIVVDDKNPEEPVVHYLDLGYKGDGTGFAERHDRETLKPNSFNVLTDGEWMPGASVAVSKNADLYLGTIINVTADKVFYEGFAGHFYVASKSDCRLLPIKPSFSSGKEVKADFVGKLRTGYKVKKYNKKIGRVWVVSDGSEEVKSIFEVSK